MYEKELKTAVAAVKASERTFRRYFGTKTQVRIKNGNFRDIVSYADKKIESEIKKFILTRFPNDGFLGEEEGASNPKAKRTWVLDPIDGTSNYIHGSPDCSISLALLSGKKHVVGVIHAPILDKLYAARKGGGATVNQKKIRVSRVTDPLQAYGAFSWGRDIDFAAKAFPKIVKKTGKVRVIGGATITLCYIAEGVYDFLFGGGTMMIWDYAAGKLILEEAGGTMIFKKNGTIQISANKTLVAKLSKIFK